MGASWTWRAPQLSAVLLSSSCNWYSFCRESKDKECFSTVLHTLSSNWPSQMKNLCLRCLCHDLIENWWSLLGHHRHKCLQFETFFLTLGAEQLDFPTVLVTFSRLICQSLDLLPLSLTQSWLLHFSSAVLKSGKCFLSRTSWKTHHRTRSTFGSACNPAAINHQKSIGEPAGEAEFFSLVSGLIRPSFSLVTCI